MADRTAPYVEIVRSKIDEIDVTSFGKLPKLLDQMAAMADKAVAERKLFLADNERLEQETKELHKAILGDEPDYSMLAHANFVEMAHEHESARLGAFNRAIAAEAETVRLREAITPALMIMKQEWLFPGAHPMREAIIRDLDAALAKPEGV